MTNKMFPTEFIPIIFVVKDQSFIVKTKGRVEVIILVPVRIRGKTISMNDVT